MTTTFRLRYSNVPLTRVTKVGTIARTREGQQVMKHIGQCMAEGGAVTCRIGTDPHDTRVEMLEHAELDWRPE